jgi:hypothetical protein
MSIQRALETVKRGHPEYLVRKSGWAFLRNAYLGGEYWYNSGETCPKIGPFSEARRVATDNFTRHVYDIQEDGYLYRHEREDNSKYARRQRASVYLNYVKPNVDTLASIVASALKVEKLPESIAHLKDDADRMNSTLEAFNRQLCIWSVVYGHSCVMAEFPEVEPGEVNSLQDEKEQGLLPYMRIVTPLELLDWSWNPKLRAFDWVEIIETLPLDRKPHQGTKEGQPGVVTRVIKPEGWTRYEDGVARDSAKYQVNLGFAPIIPIYAQPDRDTPEPLGISPMRDAAEMALLSYNTLSWKTDEEMSHCFNQLILKTEDEIDKEMDRALGNSTYIAADGAQYLAPDTQTMKHLDDSLTKQAHRARATLGLETKGEEAQAEKSGTALQLERENMDAILKGYLAQLRVGMQSVLRMMAVIQGDEPASVEVGTRPTFTQLAASTQFERVLSAVRDGGISGKARAELQKQMFLAAHPDPQVDLVADVFADIDTTAEQPTAEGEPLPEDAAPARPQEDENGAQLSDEPQTDVPADAPQPDKGGGTVAPDKGGTDDVQKTALNGAQVTAMVEIVRMTAANELPRDSAVNMLVVAFQVTPEDADSIVGAAGTAAFEPPKPEPPPFMKGKPGFGDEDTPGDEEGKQDEEEEQGDGDENGGGGKPFPFAK